jgi:hypothetical protein
MMCCSGEPASRYLEAYLQGKLSEADARRFEEHYFECPECLAQVEALAAVRAQLASQPQVIMPQAARGLLSWPLRLSALGAFAAVLLLIFIGIRARRPEPQPSVAALPAPVLPQAGPQAAPSQAPKVSLASGAVSRLADLAMPVFQASNLRGQNRDTQFDSGMKAYADHDCAEAIQHLQQVPAHDKDGLSYKFYSGVCQMHQGQMGAAAKTLRGVAHAGDSPQQEAAYYYLAQIALAANDIPTARFNLAHAFQLRGEFGARAHKELVKLREADGSASH